MYTRDFGMIYALSISLRKSVKLRPHVITGRIVDMTLVKGKEYYRLAGARESECSKFSAVKNVFLIVSLVNRFIQGEQKNTKLFDRLIDYSRLEIDTNLLHIVLVSELMITLGYLDTDTIGLKIDEYINMGVSDYVMHITIRKNEIVKILSGTVAASML
jgi:hypothetical protein